ncbi:MAG: hypothetical protein KJ970_11695 [Candidatus Eisenbacteria bacterium]|uniref:Uncharacterized protein n=1 Tax=Eiseniibacteriota bacterium TaxID=2212470 RepID=A0A948RW45_UNCEI|nr:hypothetical protein [Candidatus Eisenbacteria bacterium]MBU1950781.1 hypothetical protein [Candidatus Eisenbacteria bacterium]MBU2691581.1 hypothetical protein [Candidatus Eisenbacteria bacterium]
MKRILRSRFRNYEILDCVEAIDAPLVKKFPDDESALLFLRPFSKDDGALSTLRAVIATHCLGVQRLNDEQVIKRVARELASGRIMLVEHALSDFSGGVPEEPLIEEEAEDLPPSETRLSAAEEPHPAAYGEQAMTLVEAAKRGTPFCEECMNEEKGA